MNGYMNTSKIAEFVGYSKSFLNKNKGVLFFKDTHYFVNDTGTRWKVSVMDAWVKGKEVSCRAKGILDMVS